MAWESSSELGSVMILNPIVGNSLETVSQNSKHHMSNKLFVGNLSFNVTENQLQDTFAAYGTVTEAINTLRAKGFNLDFNLQENCLVCNNNSYDFMPFNYSSKIALHTL